MAVLTYLLTYLVMWNVQAREMTGLFPTVKMKSEHPVEGYFGIVNFRRSVISAELRRPKFARR